MSQVNPSIKDTAVPLAGWYFDGALYVPTPVRTDASGAVHTLEQGTAAGERNVGTSNAYQAAVGEWNYTVFNPRAASIGSVKGVAGAAGAAEVLLGAGAPVLVGGVYFQDDSTAAEDVLLRDAAAVGQNVAAISIGASMDFDGLKFNNGLTVCGTVAGVSAVIKWRAQ